jgi:DNA adenine methylase
MRHIIAKLRGPPSQCQLGFLAQMEVLNDIHGELVSLYRCVRHHLNEFLRMFRWSLVTRQMFEWVQMERPETLTDIQRAARFYYLQRLAFGGKVQRANRSVWSRLEVRG